MNKFKANRSNSTSLTAKIQKNVRIQKKVIQNKRCIYNKPEEET